MSESIERLSLQWTDLKDIEALPDGEGGLVNYEDHLAAVEAAVKAARVEEREACARLAEHAAEICEAQVPNDKQYLTKACARVARAMRNRKP